MPLLLLSVAVLAVLALILLPAGALLLGAGYTVLARYGVWIALGVAWLALYGYLESRRVPPGVVGPVMLLPPVLALLGYVFTLTRA